MNKQAYLDGYMEKEAGWPLLLLPMLGRIAAAGFAAYDVYSGISNLGGAASSAAQGNWLNAAGKVGAAGTNMLAAILGGAGVGTKAVRVAGGYLGKKIPGMGKSVPHIDTAMNKVDEANDKVLKHVPEWFKSTDDWSKKKTLGFVGGLPAYTALGMGGDYMAGAGLPAAKATANAAENVMPRFVPKEIDFDNYTKAQDAANYIQKNL